MNECIITRGENIKIYISDREDTAVKRAAGDLRKDLKRACGIKAILTNNENDAKIIISTVKQNDDISCPELLDRKGKLRWEAYSMKCEDGKLCITGADRRGTIYGIYELCRMAGVSPWHWFSDVPVKERNSIRWENGFCKVDYPSVKYRGIFINDEEELESWAIAYMEEKTIGPKSYEKIFELLLRLKANYIWPAMHVNAFNRNPENGRLANEMAIIVGTSHCDMLLRNNQNEWQPWLKKKGYENVTYDYSVEGQNRKIIQEYWRESVEQNRDYEVCYTVGMRGIHDSGFVTEEISKLQNLSEEEKKKEKIKLLQKVISDQQEIIYNTTGKRDSLQTFIPYKEVLSLYDGGLEVPDNVTFIWVNDNFGYMRRYPNKKEQKRRGGHGLYYHASYWAHPGMSYLFFNSTPLAHMKNELKKAYENGISRMWVLNAGAIKPLEIDIEFFLKYAWEIGQAEKNTESEDLFMEKWMNSNFSGGFGKEAAEIYRVFAQITNVRKVEHMQSGVFSQTAYGNEAARRMIKYKDIFYRTIRLHNALPAQERDSFFQMFAMKIYAAYFINASFYYGDRSILMYHNNRMYAAERYTAMSRRMDEYKKRIIFYYNKKMNCGKWDRILTPESFLPPCTALYPACKPALKIDCEGEMEECTNDKNCEVWFCKREEEQPVVYKAETGYSENNHYISIAAAHYKENTGWKEIRNLGRFEGSVMEAHGGILTYEINTVSCGNFLLELYRFPNLNSTGRIRVGVSVDDDEMQIMESVSNDEWRGEWKKNVMNNVEKMYLVLPEIKEGKHELKLHAIDRYVAFSKIVIYTREYVKSNLGPCESYHPRYNPEPEPLEFDYHEDMELLDRLCAQLFCCEKAPLPEVIYADKEFWKKNRLYLKNEVRLQSALGPKKYVCGKEGKKNVFDFFGSGMFLEEGGVLAFGTEYVLENSADAYCTVSDDGTSWEHTQSETNGRTGIAMYIAKENSFWAEKKNAPALNYRISCSGGKYNVWLLLKYDDEYNAQGGI